MSEIDGLIEASEGEMAFEQIEAQRAEMEGSSTPSPESSGLATQSPSTSLRGGDTTNDVGSSEVTSSASTCSFLPVLVALLSMCSEFLLFSFGTVTV